MLNVKYKPLQHSTINIQHSTFLNSTSLHFYVISPNAGTIFVDAHLKTLIMKRLFLLMIATSIFSISSQAQNGGGYKTALGIRLGSSVPAIKNGVTLKHFFGNKAIEGILSFGDGTALCGLYEIHRPLGISSLQWLIGAGGYVGFSSGAKSFGAAGIIGLDYKFEAIPLNVTLDWKPELNLVSRIGFEASGVGFSARFTF